ncbi:response regulator transcription factor [Natronomonas sp. EA1]|uniref:response regulator transcription factor n=1 Tax=Natronomonas sp. EA1 TaxID=3421655 RepID=UPI003EB92B84
MSGGNRGTVLVVDDERPIAEGHAARLEPEYEVVTAYDGATALERLTEDVDVVLLDRRMPGLSGDDVLSRVRENGYACRVAMVTGVEPTLDIIDMGFDDYLRKPVSGDELRRTVARLYRRATYDTKLQTYFAIASKVAVLETEHDRDVLSERVEYRSLVERRDQLCEELTTVLDELPAEEGYAVAAGQVPAGDEQDA